MDKRFTNIKVLGTAYISSSHSIFYDVVFSERVNNWRYGRSAHYTSYGMLEVTRSKNDKRKWPRLLTKPKYLIKEIESQLIAAIEAGVKYYEYDRDGNTRFENLRYFMPETERHVLNWLRGTIACHSCGNLVKIGEVVSGAGFSFCSDCHGNDPDDLPHWDTPGGY